MKTAPFFIRPLSNWPAVSEVTLSGFLLAFAQVTADPTLTVIGSGLNPLAVMLMLSGAGGVCVALMCFTGVPLTSVEGLLVALPGFSKLPRPVCKPQAESINADTNKREIKVKRFILPPCNGGNPTLEGLKFAVFT